jgi:hypothetical protein
LFKSVRRLRWLGRLLLSCLSLAAVVFDLFLPLVWAQTSSFDEAKDICRSRALQLRNENPETYVPDENDANWFLLPAHFINIFATTVSMLHFLAWLHFSPHRSARAKSLDRKRKRCPHHFQA